MTSETILGKRSSEFFTSWIRIELERTDLHDHRAGYWAMFSEHSICRQSVDKFPIVLRDRVSI